MTELATEDGPVFCDYGLSAFKFEFAARRLDQPPLPHAHLELEMVLVESGRYAMELAGTHEPVTAGNLAVYWAGLPHRRVEQAVDTVFYVAQMPIVQVLSWDDSAVILSYLLSGKVRRASASPTDAFTFERWSQDLDVDDPKLRSIVELEMQARLRRFFHSLGENGQTRSERAAHVTVTGVAAAIRYVVSHFMDHITVDDVATAVGWRRAHLMQSFHRICGLTLWEYVTRVRLNEAQRLLADTDLPVLAVCHRAGFGSVSWLYDVFRRYCDVTPSEYREIARARPVG